VRIYAEKIREAQTGAIDTGKLAEAWAALNPGAFEKSATLVALAGGPSPRQGGPTGRPGQPGENGVQRAGLAGRARFGLPADAAQKAVSPALAAFLGAAARAIRNALRAVLGDLWAEGWVLGQQAAAAVVTGERPDWRGWAPGDHAAARQIAGDGLARLLADADIHIQSIAESRVGELADVLEQALASDVREIEPYHKPPGVYSMQDVLPARNSISDLAAKLENVLDNPSRAKMVAHTEMARAQSAATLESYEGTGVREKAWLTAEDAKVCPLCDANEAEGAVPSAQPFASGAMAPPGHPLCRCALMPVVG
jgi:SPP1 gp7 family putative phage head morphogenesis protein